ncbi:MAG TPA: hypothetical protein VJX67_02590 [Blastocatellia bacterium]|nr:hypothetical protein [Blastocatellia bacterium]
MDTTKRNQGEIAKAREMLQAQQTKLRQVKAMLVEKKAEMRELESRHHTLEVTGDINKMMAVKSRSIAIGKTIPTLEASEAECLERVESVGRYLETLTRRLEGLQREREGLAEKLAVEDLEPDVRGKLQTLSSRIKMQIESLEGNS